MYNKKYHTNNGKKAYILGKSPSVLPNHTIFPVQLSAQ